MPPRLARLLAAVVAIALVAGAFALRGGLSDDEDDTTSGPSAEEPSDGDDTAAGDYRVLCDEDLGEAACDAVAALPGVAVVEVLSWGEMQSRYTEERPPFDAWLTLDPMPAVFDFARDDLGAGALAAESRSVASSALTLLTFADRRLDCPGAEWGCVADAAELQKVGVPSIGSSAGLLAAGGALRRLAGDGALARGLDPALDEGDTDGRLNDLVDSAPGALDDQQETIVTQVGRYAGIVTTSGYADGRIDRSPTRGLTAAPLAPGVIIGVALAGLGDRGDDAVRALGDGITDQTVLDALAEAGWEGGPDPSTGLPQADIIYALQERLG
ncbi:MAG TPA: hypothetical protein VK507_13340 [Iamia sp.]|nr:hypothetical protein [Iamia sp.]